MNWRKYVFIGLFLLLIGIVTFEQVYTDNAMITMINKSNALSQSLMQENTELAKQQAKELSAFWDKKEVVISLFVDYRDIEQIGRQTDYVMAYIQNGDWELACVECEQLNHVAETFYNIVKLDWQNVL